MFREPLSLQLSRTQLSLDVYQGALDLDVEDLSRAGQHEVGCTSIVGRHRHLKTRPPARMRRTGDDLGEGQLPGVAQPDRCNRVETPAELVPACCREPAPRVKGMIADAAFGATHFGLAQASQLGYSSLSQSGGHPGEPKLSAEQG
jgi:hypothetical protein